MPQQSPPTRPPGLPDLPPPPPPGNPLAWLHWTITVFRASTGHQRAALRRYHDLGDGTESMGTVAIAISTDIAMSVAKASRPR